MESIFLQLNGTEWSSFRLGEASWLIQPRNSTGELDCIHSATNLLEESNIEGLIDIIPAYNSITLIFDSWVSDLTDKILKESIKKSSRENPTPEICEIKVCYELGLDWDEVVAKTELAREEIIEMHSSQEYNLAMMGFLPGFIFLDGLDKKITVPRKESPRTKIPAGSVGIGGNQTGIYSMESPGGWQIIGRTAESFFDIKTQPPTKLKAGDKIRFQRISVEEYEKLAERNG